MPIGFCKSCQQPLDPWKIYCDTCRAGFAVFTHQPMSRVCVRCGVPSGWDRLCGHCVRVGRGRWVPPATK